MLACRVVSSSPLVGQELAVQGLVRALRRTCAGHRLATVLARGPRWVGEEVEQALSELRHHAASPEPIGSWRQRLFAALTSMYNAIAEPAGLRLAEIRPLLALRFRKIRRINVNMAVLPDGAVGGC